MTAEANEENNIDLVNELPAQFTNLEKIGGGGMGLVYRAKDTLLDRTVAIKVLSVSRASEADRKRFLREIKVLSELTHSNIVHLYSGGISKSGFPYIVMEYLDGQTLANKLKSKGSISASEVQEIFKQVLPAVSFAHTNGIIHRDISPSNIFLTESGGSLTAKLLDFGLARSFLQQEDVKLTSTGEMLGNPTYMSPEQCSGEKEPGPQSDIYAIACVIFECLTGQLLFTANTPLELMYKHRNEAADLRALDESARKSRLSAVLEKCLQKEAEKRYESVNQLSKELLQSLDESQNTTQPPKAGNTKRALLFSLVFVVLICAFVFPYLEYQKRSKGRANTDSNKSEKSAASLFREGYNVYRDAVRYEDHREYIQSRQCFEKAIQLLQDAYESALKEADGISPSDRTARRLRTVIFDSARNLSIAHEKLGHWEESKKYYKVCIERAVEHFKEDSGTPVAESDRYGLVLGYANMLKFAGRYDQSVLELQLYIKDRPKELVPGAYKVYAQMLSELSYAELLQNNHAESMRFASLALDYLRKLELTDSVHAALNETLIASNFSAMGKSRQMAEHFARAENFLNRRDDYDDQVRLLVLAGMLVRSTQGMESGRPYFNSALDCAAPLVNYPLFYSNALDSFAELELEDRNFASAESLAKKSLDKKGKGACMKGRNPAIACKILAQSAMLQGEDKKALELIDTAKHQCLDGVPVSRDIFLALSIIKARLLVRACQNLKGEELSRTRKEALEQFESSSNLLEQYEYKWRKFYIDGSAEYSRLKANAKL